MLKKILATLLAACLLLGTCATALAAEEPVTIQLWNLGDAEQSVLDEIEARVNAITEEKIGVRVEYTRISMGSYQEQLNLALSSGEEIDLASVYNMNSLTLANNGQLMPLDELLDAYAPEMKAMLREEDLGCCRVGGTLYSIPAANDNALQPTLLLNKEICDELGITYDTTKTWDEVHEDLLKVKEAYPDMYPLCTNMGYLWCYLWFDNLGDNYRSVLGVIEDALADELKVVNLFETETYREACERAYQWYQEGLLMPDGSTNSESSDNLMKAGKAFGVIDKFKPGIDVEKGQIIGKEIALVKLGDAYATTQCFTPYAWVIPSASKHPEKAMAFLNLLYSDPTISNLFVNGIEGQQYALTEDGHITYPEGADPSVVSASYARRPYAWPNQQNTYVWEGDSLDVWDQLNEFNAAATRSPAFGFVWDNSMVLNEITACTNVVNKYHRALIAGELDPAETIPRFVEELKANGIDTIVAEKQKQLDAWAAANK